MVVDLRVEIALHDILLVVPIVCACPAAWGIDDFILIQRLRLKFWEDSGGRNSENLILTYETFRSTGWYLPYLRGNPRLGAPD